MTKILLPLALLLLPIGTVPDEGQWLPPQFRAMDWGRLVARGLTLTKDQFWHPTEGGVLSAAVQINGCSASFVSAQGLLVTNHHCGFNAVRALSTVERNYLRDGFTAAGREQELPAEGMVVFIVQRIDDVTRRVREAAAAARNDAERFLAVRREMAAIEREVEAKEPDVDGLCVSYFEGREYVLIRRTKLTDVRLVYAPPQAVGEYGGETDNWMWPRHTGDFCFFRAYVGPDGRPAAHAAANVPYEPKHFLKVSAEGVKESDLVMILGYPGRTERYASSTAVMDRETALYPLRYELLTRILAVYERAASQSDAERLRFASAIKSMANVQKNALGMVRGLARNGVHAAKLAEERAFSEWVAETPERKQKYGRLLGELQQLDREAAVSTQRDVVLGLLQRYAPFVVGMRDLCRAALEGTAAQRTAAAANAKLALESGLESWQGEIIGILLSAMAALPADQRVDAFDAVAGDRRGADELFRTLVAPSPLSRPDAREALLAEGADAVRSSQDPLVILARGLIPSYVEMANRERSLDGRRLLLGPLWIEAQEQWRGQAFYPDANSTLRVSVASVKGYSPRDGVTYTPFTTLRGLLAKNLDAGDFDAPDTLVEAARREELGHFVHPDLGDVPICFLADGDTTGGNSGSPVVNGRGELVGLNFDRVFENVAGDFGWNAERSRNVCVDVRFLLFHLEKVQPSLRLLEEMGVAR